jgi:hypothetical protein
VIEKKHMQGTRRFHRTRREESCQRYDGEERRTPMAKDRHAALRARASHTGRLALLRTFLV